ncbi:MAG: flagellar hook-length control protein FliK [Sulfuriferula sp.]|nr:flagellar hook-length control protein FliK [Sulfuriferula sp.]
MLFPRPEPTGTRPVTLIQTLLPTSPLGDIREEILHRLAQINLGQQLEADVQAKLNDGSFLVKIADATTRMNLPASTNVGDKVPLTLIGREPKPTFLLNAESTIATATSSTTSLSDTAKLINTLLHNLPDSNIPTPIIGKTPIIAHAEAPTPQLAHALQDTLAKTGVFYESHLNEWINGQRTLADIQQEPQARQTEQISSIVTSPGVQLPSMPAAEQPLTQLVNQQLQVLEQNRIVWQGEVWPGQIMRWEVNEDTPENTTTSTPEQTSWRSEVSFEMAQLGTVKATLRLTGGRLALQIHTDNSAIAMQLQAQSSSLNEALAAAGIPLDGLQVKANE